MRAAPRRPFEDIAPQPGLAHDAVVARLSQALEAEVIPRLARASRLARAVGTGAAIPDAAAVAVFTDAVLCGDRSGAADSVDALHADGASFENLCFDLLAPAARRLGEMWGSDDCDFAAVTAGTWEIRRMLRESGARFASVIDQAPTGLCALLVTAPEELHTLGLAFAVEYFRRAGWDVDEAPVPTLGELASSVREHRYDIAGFTIATERRLALLTTSIRAVREASCNPAIVIVVGGSLVGREPRLVTQAGGDALLNDACTAPALARAAVAAAQGI
jgi:methylmalonyl-CoA mutase cobalamin-binding subunit